MPLEGIDGNNELRVCVIPHTIVAPHFLAEVIALNTIERTHLSYLVKQHTAKRMSVMKIEETGVIQQVPHRFCIVPDIGYPA